jgi:hypothetical protein
MLLHTMIEDRFSDSHHEDDDEEAAADRGLRDDSRARNDFQCHQSSEDWQSPYSFQTAHQDAFMNSSENHETLTYNLYLDYKKSNDHEASSTQVFERQTEIEVPNQWFRITSTEDPWQNPESSSASTLPTSVSLHPPLESQNEPTPEPDKGLQPWKPVFFGPAGSGSKGPPMTATEYETSEIFYGYRASYTGGSSSDGDRNNSHVVSDEWTCVPFSPIVYRHLYIS